MASTNKQERIIGFNTGGLHNYFKRISPEAISFIKSVGGNAIELSPLDADGLKSLSKIKKSHLNGFSYISMHAPTRLMSKEHIKDTLEIIDSVHKRLKFDRIIVHPVEIDDFSIFKHYDLPIAFENMDWRKTKYRTIKDMKKLIKDTDYPMVLDIQHAFTNDPTGKLADEFFVHLMKNIAEIHLSGLADDKDHCMLSSKRQAMIIKKVPKGIPIIIESDVLEGYKSSNEMKMMLRKELDYIIENLKS